VPKTGLRCCPHHRNAMELAFSTSNAIGPCPGPHLLSQALAVAAANAHEYSGRAGAGDCIWMAICRRPPTLSARAGAAAR